MNKKWIGEENNSFNGSKNNNCTDRIYRNNQGYVFLYAPLHPLANKDGCVAKHRLVAESVLGRVLKNSELVHHIDGDVENNTKQNLVICQDSSYHNYIHKRLRAYKISGNANNILCRYCGMYDNPKNLHVLKKAAYHKRCNAISQYLYKRGMSVKDQRELNVFR
jgi:hypothetical protein